MASLNSDNYAPANFGDAQDEQPPGAMLDIGGHGSSSPYSTAVGGMIQKQIHEIGGKTAATLNLPTGWKKRLRDFITVKNRDLLDFLQVTVPTHPVMGPAEILLRRFGNPQATPTHASVREFIMDASGEDYVAEINVALDGIRGSNVGENGLRVHGLCTQYLYEKYREAGDDILKHQATLKAKLDALDRIQGRITGLFDIDPNEKYVPLMEASEAYLEKIFKDNQIEESYVALVEAYRRFSAYRESVQMLRSPASIENEPLCSVCLSESVCYALSPCGHTFCQTCARRQVNQCPMCRTAVRDKLKIYFG